MALYTIITTLGFGIRDIREEECQDENDALAFGYECGNDLATSYGYDNDEDHFGDLDSFGKDWCDEQEEYLDVATIEVQTVLSSEYDESDYL